MAKEVIKTAASSRPRRTAKTSGIARTTNIAAPISKTTSKVEKPAVSKPKKQPNPKGPAKPAVIKPENRPTPKSPAKSALSKSTVPAPKSPVKAIAGKPSGTTPRSPAKSPIKALPSREPPTVKFYLDTPHKEVSNASGQQRQMSPKVKADQNMTKALEAIAESEANWTAEVAKGLAKQGLEMSETVGFQSGQLPGLFSQGLVPPPQLFPGSRSIGRASSPNFKGKGKEVTDSRYDDKNGKI